MEGERVYSNWISWVMAAKKLYFIRSCSRSWRVRSEAVSSSWRRISWATFCISRRSRWARELLSLISVGRSGDSSRRQSSSRGLKAPHWPARIISTALSWEKESL